MSFSQLLWWKKLSKANFANVRQQTLQTICFFLVCAWNFSVLKSRTRRYFIRYILKFSRKIFKKLNKNVVWKKFYVRGYFCWKARPMDYAISYLASQEPISFHKFWEIDPLEVYEQWFAEADRAWKFIKPQHTELWYYCVFKHWYRYKRKKREQKCFYSKYFCTFLYD